MLLPIHFLRDHTFQSQQFIQRCQSPLITTCLAARCFLTFSETFVLATTGSRISRCGSPNSNVRKDPHPGVTRQAGRPYIFLKAFSKIGSICIAEGSAHFLFFLYQPLADHSRFAANKLQCYGSFTRELFHQLGQPLRVRNNPELGILACIHQLLRQRLQ